jgi:hypothetical protein
MFQPLASKCAFVFTCASFLVGPAHAAPTFGITGAIYSYRYIAPSAELLDVRGLAAIEVFDPASLGSVLLTDTTGGTDPSFSVIPFGNSSLLAVNSLFTQVGGMLFDFTTPLYTPTTMTLRALGLPITPVPSTDAALLRLQGAFTFQFDLIDLRDAGTGDFLATYLLTGITAERKGPPSVPEPATGGLLGGAAILAAVFRKTLTRLTREA